MTEVRSHRLCWTGERYEHICHEPSGRVCIEKGCEEHVRQWVKEGEQG
jgi:hypothetical protein